MKPDKIEKWALLFLVWIILFFSTALFTSRLILRGELVTVPNLIGKTTEEARLELSRRLLSMSFQGTQFHDTIEKGGVVAQEPSAGSRVKTNRVVKITVSAGSEMVDVPDLVGKSLENAIQILASLGLTRGLISQIHTAEYPAGRIISQEPTPAAGKVKRMTPVNFLLSQGDREEKYIMPDLIGLKITHVLPQLKNLGFNVANIRSYYYPGLQPGIIIKQTPAHGYSVQKRNLISLEVSK